MRQQPQSAARVGHLHQGKWSAVAAFVLLLLAFGPLSAATVAQDGLIHNGAVWYDTSGNEIWSNGGNILQEGGTFYWVGYDTAPGHEYHPQVNLYSSTDLATWTFVKHIVSRDYSSFSNLWWMGRPSLVHNEATGQYVAIFEATSDDWSYHKIGFAVSDTIDGDYHLVNVEYPEPGRSCGDISVFEDGGHAYLLATMNDNINGQTYVNRSMAMFQLSDDFTAVGDKVYEGFRDVNGESEYPPKSQSSREAPHIIRVNGLYYWFSSALVGWNSSATKYATATSLAGPWSSLKTLATSPNSANSFNTQHDFIFPVEGPSGTTWVYAGDRYSQWTGYGTGRNIFLPVEWNGQTPTLVWKDVWSVDVPEPGTLSLLALAGLAIVRTRRKNS